ncbi:lysozyme inhibitor LprI family protein [Pantoea ananatis]|uniref:lysozyme inhibitor LprI family protein n=1 Tax=Pantoea ananas TaxID=553 RepID=UPI0032EEC941
MLLKKTSPFIMFILLSSSKAFAISCDNPINSYDVTYCYSSEMIQLDEKLNEQYKKTINSLGNEKRKMVKTSQIEWIRNRDSDCSSNGSINVACVNDKMKKRMEKLSQIERECKASGCNNDLLNRND